MTNNIDGKVIVITGASSGMGAAAALHLAQAGAKLVLGARRTDRLERASIKPAIREPEELSRLLAINEDRAPGAPEPDSDLRGTARFRI